MDGLSYIIKYVNAVLKLLTARATGSSRTHQVARRLEEPAINVISPLTTILARLPQRNFGLYINV